MRPGQQNKRGRGRGNNNNGIGNNNFNRKGGNPLTRNYDSSGPDVKIRGTAQHIAEKYASLARDAQSSGDRVMAENYFQHAEHYNRIIVLAQAQIQERYQRDDHSEYNGDGDDMVTNDGDEGVVVMSAQRPDQPERQERAERQDRRERPEHQPQTAAFELQPPVYDASSAPQPVIEGTPLEVAVEEEQQAEASARAAKPPRRAVGPRRPRRSAAAEGEETSAGD